MNNRTQSTTINMLSSGGLSVLTLLLNYFTRVIFVMFLDDSYLGINGLFTNVLSILSMADLGLTTALMYSLYKPIKDNDTQKINSLIQYFKKIYIIIAIAVAIVGLLIMPLLKYIIKLEQEVDGLYVYYLLFLADTVITYLFVYRSTLLSADQKNYVVSKWNAVFQVLRFIARVIVLALTRNFVLYLAVGVVLGFINNLILNQVSFKYYPYLKMKAAPLPKGDRKELFTNVKSTFIYKVSSVIQNNTDSILISTFVGTLLVGYYSNYTLIVNGIVSFISIVFNSLKASVGNFMSDNKTPEEKEKLFNALELVSFWLTCFASIAFFCLFDDFITISYGEQYKLSHLILIAIILNFYTSNVRQNIWAFRETTGIFNQTKYITTVTAILNLILSILMGYFWGMFGILIATTIARMVYAFWREPQILYKVVFNKKPHTYIARYFIRVGIMAVIGTLTYFSVCYIKLNNIYLEFLIKIIIVGILPNTLLFLLYFKSHNMKYLLSHIKALRKNKSLDK